MMEEDTQDAKQLWMELAKDRTYLDRGCMEDEVEQDATWCWEVLSRVVDFAANKM